MMKKKVICFDLDNTLINSEKAHVLAYNAALQKHGFKPVSFSRIVHIFGRPNQEVARILTKSSDVRLIEKVHRDHYTFLIHEYSRYARVFPGVISTLKKLKKKYRFVVLSNTSHGSILALLKSAGLSRTLFDAVVGNDDVLHPKPWPDEIFYAEKRLHDNVLFMVGDSIYDIMAGKKARVKTIAILSGRYTRKQLAVYQPDFFVKEFKDLLTILPL